MKLTNRRPADMMKEKRGELMVVLDTEIYLDTVCRMLEEGCEAVPVPIRGVSMRPFLRDGDFAYLVSLPEKIRPGDILLFQRPNNRYVLHRVRKIKADGSLLLLGDSQLTPERVAGHQLRAKVSFVRCGGQDCRPGSFRWWFFAHPWRVFAGRRPQIAKLLALFRRK